MKIPRKVKVGGIWYKVRMCKLDKDDAGEVDKFSNTIKIAKELPRKQKEITLIHELMHLCNYALPESVIEPLGEMLFQILTENKLF